VLHSVEHRAQVRGDRAIECLDADVDDVAGRTGDPSVVDGEVQGSGVLDSLGNRRGDLLWVADVGAIREGGPSGAEDAVTSCQ
jgi:hypothetical protein